MKELNRSQHFAGFKRVLRCGLVVLLATACCVPLNISTAYAEPTTAELQAEADQVSATLAAAEAELVQIGEDYQLAIDAHEAAIAAMAEAQSRIDAAQETIAYTQEKLGIRANQMYRQGSLSFLDVIFGASSFEGFTTSWDLLNAINEESAALIKTNKDARAEAEAAHAEFSSQEKVAAERKAEAEAVKVKAENLIAEQKALLESLTAEVAKLVEAEQALRLAAQAQTSTSSSSGGSSGTTAYKGEPVPEGGYGGVVAAAASRIGSPYVAGGSGPDEFDCSGLTSWAYAQAGYGSIGRSDSAQAGSAASKWPYSDGGAQPGDVLWWPGHVAIYAGGDSYIHSPQPGESVSYSSRNIENATVLRF